MGAEKFDKNFTNQSNSISGEKDTYQIPCAPFSLHGIKYSDEEDRFFRIEQDIAKSINSGVEYLAKNTAGGRLRFSTNSTTFGIKVEYDQLDAYTHMSLEGSCGFILKEELDGEMLFLKHFTPLYADKDGFSGEVSLRGGTMRDYVLYFPNYNVVKSLSVFVDKGAIVGSGKKYEDILPILYYGSSITQGACASRADNCYQAYVSEWRNIDYINLGFSGSARAEQTMIDYLTDIDCSLFVCDYDHNSPDTEHLKNTHYKLYCEYRKKRKDVPIIFISRPDFYKDDDSNLRRKIIYSTYLKAKRSGDKNVYFINGESLFTNKDRSHCTVDKAHPNDLGFYRIAKAIDKKISKIPSLNKK